MVSYERAYKKIMDSTWSELRKKTSHISMTKQLSMSIKDDGYPHNHQSCKHEIYDNVVPHSDNLTCTWDPFFLSYKHGPSFWFWTMLFCVSMQPNTSMKLLLTTVLFYFCILVTMQIVYIIHTKYNLV